MVASHTLCRVIFWAERRLVRSLDLAAGSNATPHDLSEGPCTFHVATDLSCNLYWVDFCSDSIQTSSLSGSNHMDVLASGIMPQYGVDVFEDTVYWLEGGSIYATSTEPGGLVVQLYSNEDGTTLRDITVVHTSRQPSARKLHVRIL